MATVDVRVPAEQPPVLLSPTIPGLQHPAGYVLAGLHSLTDVPPRAERCRSGVQASIELGLVVERGHDDVATLVPVRVVPVVPNHVPLDGVVIRVYCGHIRATSNRAGSDITAHRACADIVLISRTGR